eukprot:CAMPEP_0194683674 /NCGR_PEP_ID=MMETSP0295-20121207/13591_1 /TAXON_ID=39354 /ORGANISM="Heterosigma akashiwo, Strain CCMP2393" /LENGTH=95 /DNA_ID=CAMNT_0039570439 /DNA_START=257 /DNA_END=541 /DNA_ORIENTATION=+
MEFLTSKIDENFSNYSAWHYRARLLPGLAHSVAKGGAGGPSPGGEDPRVTLLRRELDHVEQIVFTEPDDQSVWWYLRHLLAWARGLEERRRTVVP